MNINKYRPYILILPEDDANRQLANGFLLDPNLNNRAIQVLPPAGGWTKVVEQFMHAYAATMTRLSDRQVVLLIDFDHDPNRLSSIQSQIPNNLKQRVFIIGVESDPESLRRNLKMDFEKTGEALAKDCSDNTNILWGHDLLKHNRTELNRMISSVKPYLFN